MQVLSVVILFSVVERSMSSVSFTCAPPLPLYSPSVLCAGVVDYPFILLSNLTLENLDARAKTLAIGASIGFGQGCASSLKRLFCGRVYLPCVEGVVADDLSTYKNNSGVLLPYKKPCRSLCESVLSPTVGCGSFVLTYLVFPEQKYSFPNCNEDYYDTSNNPDICNALSPSVMNQHVVGKTVEPYVGQVCSGLSTSVYIPDSYIFQSYSPIPLAPLLPSGILQSVIEAVVDGGLAQVPHTFNSLCLNTQKQILCSSLFLNVQDIVFFGNILQFPRFPQYSNCVDYNTYCAALISLSSTLKIDCEQSVPLGGLSIKLYPKQIQVVSRLQQFNFSTSPLNISTLAYPGIETSCPNGFGVVTDPTKPGLKMITDSCAMNCPNPAYTAEQQLDQSNSLYTISFLNTIFSVVGLVNLFNSPTRQNFFVVGVIAVRLPYYAYDMLQRIAVKDANRLVCANSVEYHTISLPSDSPEHGVNQTLARNCHFFALMKLFILFFFYMLALLLFLELMAKISFKTDIKAYRKYYVTFGMSLQIMNGLICIYHGNQVPFSLGGVGTRCSWTSGDSDLDFNLQSVPNIVMWFICVFFFLIIFFSLLTGAKNENGDSYWKTDGIALAYLFVFIGPEAILTLFFGWYVVKSEVPSMVSSVKEWITCIFTNYIDSSSQSHVDSFCGTQPKVVLQGEFWTVVFFYCFSCASTMIITFDSDAQGFWYRLLTGKSKINKVAAFAYNSNKGNDPAKKYEVADA